MIFLILSTEVLIIGGVALFSILILFIILFILASQKKYYQFLQEQNKMKHKHAEELRQTQLETQEETFYHIGEEIHDNIGQLLTSTKLLLSITERSMPAIPESLITAQDTLTKAIQELRSLSKSLNKEWLHQFNIIQNLHTETARVNSAQLIRASFTTSLSELDISSEDQIILFRIIQEALQNSIKHAEARMVQIMIHSAESGVQVIVTDDGSGFDIEKHSEGIGIMNMKHRTRMLGGRINWSNKEGQGTDVEIFIPWQKPRYEN